VKRFIPDSVAGWVIVVLVAGLAVTQVVTITINANTRSDMTAVLAHFRLADRMADLVRLVVVTPPAQRSALLTSVRSGTLHASWGLQPAPAGVDTNDARADLFSQVMQASLWDVAWHKLRVSFAPAPIEAAIPGGRPSDRSTTVGRRLDRILAQHARVPLLRVALQLDDGSWVSFEAPFVEEPEVLSLRSLLALALAALGIVVASIWAVRRLTDPLVTLARAAERLGSDVNAPPLAERGASELRQAARAFNTMQSRVQRFVHDRLQMTAAISHDLRTPITRLRLRAELVEDEEQRRKMLADLEHMEALIDATLAFAREEDSKHEAASSVDLVSLVEDLCEDRPSVTFQVAPDLGPRLPCVCRPVAIRRCVDNIIDNAVKYGEIARVRIEATPSTARIIVEDDGPGIPDSDLERVFQPYERLENSRNQETGGAGLGLAIARMIARAHGGEVRLRNRQGGGLTASVELPRG
jgi:signal transduction histidine kinase